MAANEKSAGSEKSAGAPVGPVPAGADPESYDRLRRRVLWSLPTGLYLVGSRAGEAANLMTANWAMQVATEPKLLAVSVEKPARTHQLISEGRCFSLTVLAREDRALVRRFVKPAVWDPAGPALAGEPVRFGLTGAPILTAGVAWLDCRLAQSVDAGSHTVFFGEVVDAGFSRDESEPVLRMEDTRMNYGG